MVKTKNLVEKTKQKKIVFFDTMCNLRRLFHVAWQNDVTEEEQRWGSKTVEGSGHVSDAVK